MLFEIAKSIETVIILGKTVMLPKNSWFHVKDYSVATFVHINLPKTPFSFLNKRNLALNIMIMVV